MKSDPRETASCHSLPCRDKYIMLGDEQQNLLEEPVVTIASVDVPVELDAMPQNIQSHHSTAAMSSELPFVPSQLSMLRSIDGGWGWMVVVGAFFVHVIIDGFCNSVGVLFVDLHEYFEGSRSKLSLVAALMYAMPMLLAPISSALIDIYDCRVVGLAGGLLSAIGAVAGAFATSVDILILVFGCLVGIGMSLTLTTSFVIMVIFFEQGRTVASGLAISGIGVGTTVLPPLIELMLNAYTWRGTFLIMGALFLQAGAFCLFFRPVENRIQCRQRRYLRTLEIFSHAVGFGDFLVDQDYQKSSLSKRICMLRTHCASNSAGESCSAAHTLGNSTLETMTWPSIIDDSTTSSSSSHNSATVATTIAVSTAIPSQNNHQQEILQGIDNYHPPSRSIQGEIMAPKAEIESDEDEETADDEFYDPLLLPDALVCCLREIETYDNMPDPESYRIPLPDPILDAIPEHEALDFATCVLSRVLCSSSSSSDNHVQNTFSYDTYLDLSNPRLDDDNEEDDAKRAWGRLSYKSLPSVRSTSSRLTSLGSTTSQSLGSLVPVEYDTEMSIPKISENEYHVCRAKSDPELLRRHEHLSFDSSSSKLLVNDLESCIMKISSAEVSNGNVPTASCWEPLLLPGSPAGRGETTKKESHATPQTENPVLKHELAPAEELSTFSWFTGFIPFASIGRLCMALSIPRFHVCFRQNLPRTDRRRHCRNEFDFNSADLLSMCSRRCHCSNSSIYPLVSCRQVFSNTSYLCLFISNFLVYCFYNMTMIYLGQYSASVGATSEQLALHFSMLGFSNFFGQMVFGLIGNLRHIDNVIFFFVMQSLIGVSTIIGPLLTSYASIFIHAVLFGLAISGNDVLSTVLCVQFLGLEKVNSGIGINLFGQGVANLIGPPIIGFLIDLNGSYSTAFEVCGVGLILAGIVMIPAVIINHRRRNHRCCSSNFKQQPAISQSVAFDQRIGCDVKLA